ncbi:hypothetical protein ABT294_39645 [Nonomuraea sp. NPDC000554]
MAQRDQRLNRPPGRGVRLAEGREPEPSAGIIDSQSLRAAETSG